MKSLERVCFELLVVFSLVILSLYFSPIFKSSVQISSFVRHISFAAFFAVAVLLLLLLPTAECNTKDGQQSKVIPGSPSIFFPARSCNPLCFGIRNGGL